MIPKSHPRYKSLVLREKIVEASKEGILADSALIAHGRGEAFDYLLGERTIFPAKRAMYVTVASMLLATNPVISVNGNTTALAIDEIIELAKALDAKIEINLFYRTDERVEKIAEMYKERGWENILGTNDDELKQIKNIKNPRASASKTGIYNSDVVLVPLEDGDRAEILSKTGKTVIAIDLNPLSRTAIKSDITIVDNVVRAIPFMTKITEDLKDQDKEFLINLKNDFNNKNNLADSLNHFKIKG